MDIQKIAHSIYEVTHKHDFDAQKAANKVVTDGIGVIGASDNDFIEKIMKEITDYRNRGFTQLEKTAQNVIDCYKNHYNKFDVGELYDIWKDEPTIQTPKPDAINTKSKPHNGPPAPIKNSKSPITRTGILNKKMKIFI